MLDGYIPAVSDPANAGRLRFDTQDDALNYAKELVKRGNEWAIAQGVRTPREDYLEAQCEIVLQVQFASGRKPRDFKLVMQVVPFVDDDLQGSGSLDNCLPEGGGILVSSSNAGLVSGTCEAAHRPQNPVAVRSIVRLKSKAIVDEALVDVDALPFYFIFEVFRVSSEREVDSLCIFPSERNGRFTKGLVKREPQFLQDAGREVADFRRESVLEAQFNDLLSGLWVGMGDNFVFARLADCLHQRFKLGNAFFSAIE